MALEQFGSAAHGSTHPVGASGGSLDPAIGGDGRVGVHQTKAIAWNAQRLSRQLGHHGGRSLAIVRRGKVDGDGSIEAQLGVRLRTDGTAFTETIPETGQAYAPPPRPACRVVVQLDGTRSRPVIAGTDRLQTLLIAHRLGRRVAEEGDGIVVDGIPQPELEGIDVQFPRQLVEGTLQAKGRLGCAESTHLAGLGRIGVD